MYIPYRDALFSSSLNFKCSETTVPGNITRLGAGVESGMCVAPDVLSNRKRMGQIPFQKLPIPKLWFSCLVFSERE